MTELLLDAREVRVQFGGLTAVNDVDFNIPVGVDRCPDRSQRCRQDHVLQRAHRALHADAGPRRLRRPVGARCAAAHDRRRGMARTFQNIRLFGAMTAAENVMVAMHPHLRSGVASTILRLPKQRHEERDARNTAKELLEFVGIGGTDEEFAKNLPYGDQRRLEVARALALQAEAAAARRADRRA